MTTHVKNPAKVSRRGDREIHVERTFHAPRELVWRAQADSGLIAQWWGRGHRMEVERNDVRPGPGWSRG